MGFLKGQCWPEQNLMGVDGLGKQEVGRAPLLQAVLSPIDDLALVHHGPSELCLQGQKDWFGQNETSVIILHLLAITSVILTS